MPGIVCGLFTDTHPHIGIFIVLLNSMRTHAYTLAEVDGNGAVVEMGRTKSWSDNNNNNNT